MRCFFFQTLPGRIVAAILVFFASQQAHGEGGHPDVEKLNHQFLSELSAPGQDELLDASYRREWISAFEQAIPDASLGIDPKDNQVYSALTSLARLYALDNQGQLSLATYDRVISNQQLYSNLRLQAAKEATGIAPDFVDDWQESARRCDDYAQLLASYKNSGTVYNPIHDKISASLQAKKPEMIIEVAERVADSLRESGQVDAARQFLQMGRSAADQAYEAYLAGLTETIQQDPELGAYLDSMNQGPKGTLYRSAENLAQMADSFDARKDNVQAEATRNKVVSRLETLLSEFPRDPEWSNAAADLLFYNKWTLSRNASEFVEYVEGWLPSVAKGLNVLSTLGTISRTMSMNDQSLVAANRLIDSLVALEETWYPGEYTEHPDYQWALITKAQNLLALGATDDASDLIEVLRTLRPASSGLSDMIARLQDKVSNNEPEEGDKLHDLLDNVEHTYRNGELVRSEGKALMARENLTDRLDELPAEVASVINTDENKPPVPTSNAKEDGREASFISKLPVLLAVLMLLILSWGFIGRLFLRR